MLKSFAFAAVSVFTAFYANAQTQNINELDQKYLNWYNLDLKTDQILGASVEKAYRDFLHDKQSKKTIIVAVIDGGVDIDHEDLKGKIWVNEDEIPGNNIDDDKNGYIDDIHGWNFIGNGNGKNIHYENLEYTRIIKSSPTDPDFEKAKQYYERELAKRTKEKENVSNFERVYSEAKAIIKEHTGVTVNSPADLTKISSSNPQVIKAKQFLESRYKQGLTEQGLVAYKQHVADYIEYYLNKEFSPRSIVGDDPYTIDNKPYGNADVKGPRADTELPSQGSLQQPATITLG